MPLCEEIKKVKDFLLFKKIFENEQGKNQPEPFNDAIDKLEELKYILYKNTSNIEIIFYEPRFKNIFKDIKEEFGKIGNLVKKDESKSDLFIDQMIDYFNIKDKIVIKDLKIIIKSKKYEMILKSIKYFFDNLSNKKLTLPRNINLSEMSLKDLKRILQELKHQEIFDFESNSPYYKIFTSLYDKKEAIEFLLSKMNTDVTDLRYKLINKLEPNNRILSINDIDDTIECLIHFKSIINLNTSQIINYFKSCDEEMIAKFKKYSKKYNLIIELDRKDEIDPFDLVYNIIQDTSLIFNLDNEDFVYYTNGDIKSIKNIEKLIELKNKIKIEPKNNTKETEYNDYKKEEKDLCKIKCDKLIFF